MQSLSPTLLFLASAAAAFGGIRVLLPFLKSRAILDHPNERSSHETPTPKGGGIVLAPIIVLCWVVIGLSEGSSGFLIWGLSGCALILAALSWFDDLKGLSPAVRLLAQIGAVVFIMIFQPNTEPYFQGLLPVWLDSFLAGLLWVWFINLFNFMDGIDGITGVESLIIGGGVALIGGGAPALLGLAIAGAALGFLKWNWHPAKIFLGDVGSVPFGFLLGWLLLDLAASGQWSAALILPAYYLADSGLTLVRRALKGEKVWQAHRQHFYQQATQRGLTHGFVSVAVLVVGILLIGLAYVSSIGESVSATIAALVLSIAFLIFLRGWNKS